MKNPYKTLKSKVVYQTKWIKIIENKIIIDGKNSIFSFLTPKCPKSISVIARDSKGNFYLVRQWRYTQDKATLEFVAGGVEKNETPLHAAKRELFEELGLFSKKWTFLGRKIDSPGLLKNDAYVYLAENIKIKEENFNNIEEYTEKVKMTEKKLLELIKKNKILDNWTIGAFMKYLLYKNKIK